MTPSKKEKRIIIVSNRLPVTIHKGSSGLEYRSSTGGLATGLSSLQDEFETAWIGWPGSVAKEDKKTVETRLVSDFKCHPVYIPEQLIEKYYEGYSNRTVWPIFHSFSSYAKYSAAEWEAYKKANTLFGQKILEVYRPGDILWIHDYHLMLLPKYLRDHARDITMGFFLHIPFPHYDIFRLLPQHREILESLLTFDLIGFHTHDYAQAFLGCVRRLLGYDNTLGQLLVGDHMVQVDVFPMGIDFKKYSAAPLDPELSDEIASIRSSLKAGKAVFSVSRLDYTKGIPESLDAIKEFFEMHREWHEKVVFILVVVPSREKVERYASLKREIDELVGRINSSYGTLEWQPIRYIYRSLTFGELIGLYTNADVALVTPLRDGMNLIAKEYLTAKQEDKGVLVLSELAGAAKELLEAITVNPNSKEEIAQAIHKALMMPVEEQQRRNRTMRERLEAYDLYHWVRQFFNRLKDVREASIILAVKFLDSAHKQELFNDYTRADSRLLMLDYDGTLVHFVDEPGMAIPDAQILAILERLSSVPTNHVVILSGRDRHTLGEWLGHLNLTLVAEHGGWVRRRDDREWNQTTTPPSDAWKKDIRPILELFVGRIPGSMIEEKDYSLVWHYRKAENESASLAARELLDTLSTFLANLHIQVLPGNKTIEVRTMGIGKGVFYTNSLSTSPAQFILAIGDDWTDEDLFAVIPSTAYSIKVAPRISKARYNLKSVHEVRALLEKLASQSSTSRPLHHVTPTGEITKQIDIA
ncbi:MAG: trehalose-6-phosphate synthase [Bacteroidetes bacterium]|nr:trehalose-6-phosphate synthase [Bacteroidota bacterium]